MKAEWIFQQGCAFSDCAQALEIENRMKYDVFFATHTHAAIALSAFASELFIKCLLEKYGSVLQTKVRRQCCCRVWPTATA